MRQHRREERDDRDEPVRSRPRRIDEPAPSSTGDAPPERGLSRGTLWWILIAALLLLVAIVAQHFDEYLRRTIESKVNQRLHGYTVTLQGAHLNPFGLALTLRGAVIRQQAHPNPPVADISQVKASVQWKEILHLRLVSNVVIDRPRIHVNLKQLQEEDRDSVGIEDRGWQEAFQSIYPLKFNQVQVRDGQLVYVDKDPKRPLELSRVNLIAENIRNTRDDKVLYPSPVRAEGVLFGTGRAVVKGHADFLSKPYPGMHVLYQLSRVPLERLDVLSSRANLDVDDLRLDYIHTAATASAEKDRAAAASRVAKDDQPEMLVRLDRVHVTDSNFALVNRDADHPYRVYVSGTDLTVTNLSSGFREGAAKARLTGKFMGSGAARANATFREPSSGPNFDFNIAIEGASLPAMNDLLRSYGKLDVVKGTFSVYSEIKIKDQQIVGYVKPLIKDVDVYDSKQDKKKPVLKKIYEKIVGGLSHVLENKPRDEVATVVDISGPIEDPNASIWETVVRLVSNAFVKAILPGFDREFEAAQRGR